MEESKQADEVRTVEGLMALVRDAENAAGAMIVNAGGRSFYEAKDRRDEARRKIEAYAASLATQAQQGEPAGWKLVPAILSPQMMTAAFHGLGISGRECSARYSDMLAASPTTAGQQAGGGEVCRFPDCRCPMDPGPEPDWCAKGLPHAPGVNPSAPAYRLLTIADTIQAGDECLRDDAVTWGPLAGWEVGMRWHNGLMPLRRRTNGVPELGHRTDCPADADSPIPAEVGRRILERLTLIAGTDPVDAALDPQRAVRVARAAITELQQALEKTK